MLILSTTAVSVNVVQTETKNVNTAIACTYFFEAFSAEMETTADDPDQENNNDSILFINIIYIIAGLVLVFILVLAILGIISFIRNYSFASRRRRGSSIKIRHPKKRKRRHHRNDRFHDSW